MTYKVRGSLLAPPSSVNCVGPPVPSEERSYPGDSEISGGRSSEESKAYSEPLSGT